MAYSLFRAPSMPKFDPAAPPRPNFAIHSIIARRNIIVTLVMESRRHHNEIHELCEPIKAATRATGPVPARNPPGMPIAPVPNTPEQALCTQLNAALDSCVSRLITALATILRIRYIHIPKRAHTSPEHADYVAAAREHNSLLCQTREFAVALLTETANDTTASIANAAAATNILIRLATPLLDAADFNPATTAADASTATAATATATAPAAVQAATTTSVPPSTAATTSIAAATSPAQPAPSAPTTAAAVAPAARVSAVAAPTSPAKSPQPPTQTLYTAPTPTRVPIRPAAPVLPKPAPKGTHPRDLEQKIAASNSAPLLSQAG